jgi:alpha-tubulin suppressor-like RCC1 family protein
MAMTVLAAAGLAAMGIPGAAAPARAAAALAAPSIWGMGVNSDGELGNGNTSMQRTPVQAAATPAAAVQISAGGGASAAVLANGQIATWGDNTFGQLGLGPGPAMKTVPTVVPGLAGMAQVAMGYSFALALDSAGTVWSWGSNPYGELGNGTTSSAQASNPTPVPVPGLAGVIQVSAGEDYSLALMANGTVWAWGRNDRGQLGDRTTVSRNRPEQIPGLSGITRISAGISTSYAIGAGGTLLAWGDNYHGLLGNGTTSGFATAPTVVPGITGVTAVSSGVQEALAIAGSSRALWAWGSNGLGESGDGTTTAHFVPQQSGPTGLAKIAAGSYSVLAVTSGGQLLVWGTDVQGQLGYGDSGLITAPTPVIVLAGVTQIAATNSDSLVIASPAPRVPSVISLDPAGASSVLEAAGFHLGRVAQVVDITCQYLGEVKSQSPAAGTIAQPGTSVNVSVGKAGGKCLGD